MTVPSRNPSVPGRTIGPGRYFAIGLALAQLKMELDILLAWWGFGRDLSSSSFAVAAQVVGLFSTEPGDRTFWATILALHSPFVAVVLVLTARRLRDAGWPTWLAACLLAPLPINAVFFFLLSLVPARTPSAPAALEPMGDVPKTAKKTPRPRFALGRALAAILILMPVAGAAAYSGTHLLGNYGWSLFVGLPFVLPMLSVIIYGFGREVTAGQSLLIACLWVAVTVLTLIATAFEGMICILMMLPLAVPIALSGALLGYCVVAFGSRRPGHLGRISLVMVALLPTMIGAEHLTAPEPLLFTCRTSVVVDAPSETVWRNVVSFSDLDPPEDWVFRTGLAYPIRARIEGAGPGAVRRCEFSTGAFVEPIEVWDEPRLLRFAVTSNPPPMREWNPVYEIHPPHLDGFLVSKRGQFRLIPLEGGRTLLVGSTLYQHGLWPASYWRLWSDPIIHRIHDRVLRHIKTLSERH